MKRREALKNIGLGTGFVIATPTLVSLLQSCTAEGDNWVPVFFSEEEGMLIQGIADVMLPKTELPSASDLNVPQFIDKFMDEVADDEERNKARAALGDILAVVKSDYNENLKKVTAENYKDLLDKHMRVKNEDDEERLANPDSEAMTKSEVLNQLKWMVITAYKTTEMIGEEVLAYDPIPSQYYCGDLDELTGGKSWSLGW